jgi:hypothetical protein
MTFRHRLVATILLGLMPVQALPQGSATPPARRTESRQSVQTTAAAPAARNAAAAVAVPATVSAAGRRQLSANAVAPHELALFGPQKYIRTTGSKDVYTTKITVPAWLASPFRLHIQNGEPDGTHRVSSATVEINGVAVNLQNDFNQNVLNIDRTVTLTPSTTLTVTLASQPASYLLISFFGTSTDTVAPPLSWVHPAADSTVNSATPRLLLHYSDALSGVDLDSLQVFLDNTDRTSWFTRRSDEASADVPETTPDTTSLRAGVHTFRAAISDRAGNVSQITGQFRVDLTAPAISVTAPAAASYLATLTPGITLHYSDDVALDPASLSVAINGTDQTSLFTATATGATGTVSLSEGSNTVVARIRDLGGNESTATSSFFADVTASVLVVAQPAAASRVGNPNVAVTLTYADNLSVDPATVMAAVDGAAVTLATDSDTATGTIQLTDGPHVLTARIADRAGNITTQTVDFIVDTTVPVVRVVTPAPGAFIRNAKPVVQVEYADAQGIDAASVKISINGTDRTSLFTIDAAKAVATLTEALPDGANSIVATVADSTANQATVMATFTVDTVKPAGAFVEPGALVNTSTPRVAVSYTDSGSGIDAPLAKLFVDDASVTPLLTAGAESAQATLNTLADGPHSVRISFADRAGNVTTIEQDFVVDTVLPSLEIVAPENDSFTSTTRPALRVRHADLNGTGVATGTLKLTLGNGSAEAVDVTGFVTVGAAEAIGQIPADAPLADGTYVFRAEVQDLAGNVSVAEASFELDTVAPTYTIDHPAANEHVNTGRPVFNIRYADELSGIDLARTRIRIDGVLRTAIFVFEDGVATGTLPAGETLADGQHTIDVRFYDRAGNLGGAGPQAFIVDTVAPVAAITAPMSGAYLAKPPYALAITFTDGSGVDPAAVRITLDGTDRTADFTITTTAATAQLADVLADGSHSVAVFILDWAGNRATAESTFKVDSAVPAVQLTAPAADAWINTSTVTVSGSVTDASPVSLDVNGLTTLPATDGTFTIAVPATEGTFAIKATATDAAGNSGNAQRSIHVDLAAPVITITSPAANVATNQTSITLAGTVADASDVTLKLNGQPLALTGTAFSTTVQLPVEGTNTFTLTAADPAGNSSTATVSVIRDMVAPQLLVASPVANSVIGTTPVVVSGTVTDATATTVTVNGTAATVTGEAWQVSLSDLPEGIQTLTVAAADAAGNSSSVLHELTLDLSAPSLVITSPANGTLTKLGTVTITGTATDQTLRTVTAAGVTATLEAGSADGEKKFTLAAVPLTEGDNTIRVIATDALSREGTASLLVTSDATAPSIAIDAPAQLTRSRGARAKATVTDNLSVKSVTFTLDGTDLATLTAPPYEAALAVPAAANVGDVLTLTVVATDTAGNSATATYALRVAAEGAVSGQVLSDTTGLPLANATVRVANSTGRSTTTDARGRYALPANESALVLIVEKAGHTTVERTVAIESGVGTVPVDARLTPRATATNIGTNGGTLTVPGITVTIPAGAAASTTGIYLTRLSAQGLPNLLPLGWSPAAAFDVTAKQALATVPLPASLTGITTTADLVFYKPSLHAWVAITPSVAPAAGRIDVTLPEPGTYALAVRDDLNVTAAVAGAPLEGVAMQAIPENATSSGEVTPATLPVTGGNATGLLTVHTSTPLPSGTVVQTAITETFSLSTGETASEESRTQDVVLNRSGTELSAQFPVVPSRSFATGELVEGRVHLDILAGREAIRGRTGGSQPLSLDAGNVNVTIAAGSLTQDLAISATPVILSSFLPATAAATPHAEVLLDFSGVTLAVPAELSISDAGIAAGETVVIARVERIGGVPKVIVAAATDRVGNRFVSRPLPDFAGLETEGRYVFYRVGLPWGVVSGTASAPRGPLVAQANGFPFVAIADASGQFNLIAPTGNARITASVPNTPYAGETTVSVTSSGTATVNLPLAAGQTIATVTPADGAIQVLTSAQIEIAATAPLRASTAGTGTIQLRSASGAAVTLRFVLSGSGRVLAVIPANGLEAGQTYTLTVAGLADDYGNPVAISPVTFSTAAVVAPSYDTSRIVFSMPGDDGMVTVSAPAGSLPPGTRILIVNSGNGVVVSYTAGNDGSFTGQFPATISDRLLVTITDPQGNVTSFDRSRWESTDGSGRVAIGPAGGTVEGTGGTAIILPDGALAEGAVFKVESFGPETYPERPDFPGAHFGSGLRITSEQMPTLKKEGDLVFPKPPDAPEGSFYYVYRRLTGPNGEVAFETIDHAFENAEGKIVTASYPFIGWKDSTVSWQAQADLSGVGFGLGAQTAFYLMYSWDSMMPGLATQGVVAGKVFRPVWKPGATEPEYQPVAGAMVRVLRENSHPIYPTVAQSGPDGTFSLWDALYTGGTVDIEGALGNDYATATAFEANVANTRTSAFGANLRYYGFGASANLTFPPAAAEEVAKVKVHLATLGADGKRKSVGGIAQTGMPLIIGFTFTDTGARPTIQSANVDGVENAVRADSTTDPLKFDFVVSDTFTPAVAGRYVISAVALPPLGSPIVVNHTILVIAAGGSNGTPLLNSPPDIISGLLYPEQDSTGVDVTVMPQIVFTEPVKNVAANVALLEDGKQVAVKISAVAVDANGNTVIINDLGAQPSTTAVTSITLQPIAPLKFGTGYTVELSSGISDVDKTADGADVSKQMLDMPRKYRFRTFEPTILGQTGSSYNTVGIVAFEDRAYVAESTSPHGKLRIFSITPDPSNPSQVAETYVAGIPTTIGGEEFSPVNGGRLVTVPAATWVTSSPSNLWIYDVDNDEPKRIGAVSLSESTGHGITLRVFVKGRYAYAWTYPIGMQVIDLIRARDNYTEALSDAGTRMNMFRDLVTEGRGFGQDAVINTIPLRTETGALAHIFGVKAADYVLNVSQTFILATGSIPLAVINPQTSEVVYREATIASEAGSLTWGWNLGVTRVADRDLVVVAGKGSGKDENGVMGEGSVIAVLDMANPAAPKLIGSLRVAEQPLDIAVRGSVAVVSMASKAILVSLSTPSQPTLSGTMPSLGGRLAIHGATVFGTGSGSPALTAAALGSAALIRTVSPRVAELDTLGKTDEPVEIEYQLVAPSRNVTSGTIQIVEGDQVIHSVPLPSVKDGVHQVTIPKGLQYKPDPAILEVGVTPPGASAARISTQAADPASPTFTPAPLVITLSAPVSGVAEGDEDGDESPSGDSPTPAADTAVIPLFGVVEPAYAYAGSGPLAVKIRGSLFDGLEKVYVRKGQEWTEIVPRSKTTFEMEIVLPAELLQSPDFLQIAGEKSEERSLAFMVAQAGLPMLGTSGTTVSWVSPEALTPDVDVELRAVTSPATTAGDRLVLGIGTTPGLVLDTQFVNERLLSLLPWTFPGGNDDLFVAVLSADGTKLSEPYPLSGERTLAYGSTVEEQERKRKEREWLAQDAGEAYGPDAVAITAYSGTARWHYQEAETGQPLEKLVIRGVGLIEGMPVYFRGWSGNRAVEETATLRNVTPIQPVRPPDDGESTNAISANATVEPSRLFEATVDIPDRVTRRLHRFVRLVTKNEAGIQVLPTVQTAAGASATASIPYGGRLAFKIYRGPCTKKNAADTTVRCYEEKQYYAIAANEALPQGVETEPVSHGEVKLRVEPPASAAEGVAAQVEHENGDTKTNYVRGLRLTLNPLATGQGTNVQHPRMRVIVNGVQSGPERQTLKLSIVKGTTVIDDRQAEVVFTSLGRPPRAANAFAESIGKDIQIALAADEYGIPPHFLKGQADQESGILKTNFRYEPNTKDFQELSGDIARDIYNPPFSYYALKGKALAPSTAVQPSTPFDGDGVKKSFSVNKPIKRVANAPALTLKYIKNSADMSRANARYELGCSRPEATGPCPVKAVIGTMVNGTFVADQGGELKLVLPEVVWRFCAVSSASATGCEQRGGFSDPPVPVLGPGEASVDYETGTITLANPLPKNKRLQFSHHPVAEREAGVPRGENVPNIDLNNKTLIRKSTPVDQHYYYEGNSRGGTGKLSEYFDHNVQDPNVGSKWLAGTISDGSMEFREGPRRLRDPRYAIPTAQYWAGSSYGVLQMTLAAFTQRKYAKMLEVLDVRNKNNKITDLLNGDTALRLGLRLAGAYHFPNISDAPCREGCNDLRWAQTWSRIFNAYNSGGDGYKLRNDCKPTERPQDHAGCPADTNAVIRGGWRLYQPASPGQ